MRAFTDSDLNLYLIVEGETPEELSEYKTVAELVRVHFPRLQEVDPKTIKANTGAPVFKLDQLMWWLPNYQEIDPLETLRDTGTLRLDHV